MNKFEKKKENYANIMGEALTRLLEKKEFDDITITDLCKEAGVNRSTFYSHYNNMMDLLQEAVDHTLMVAYEIYEKENKITLRYMIPYLDFVKEHQMLMKIYNQKMVEQSRKSKVYDLIYKKMISQFYENGFKDETNIQYSYQFYIGGMVNVINGWLENGCREEVEDIYQILKECILHNN